MSVAVMKRILLSNRIKFYKRISSRCISSSSPRQNVHNNILVHPNPVEIPRVSIPEFLFSQNDYSAFTAFECPTTQRKYTYGELRTKSRNFSKVLRKKIGLQKGDVALIYSHNLPEFPIAALGCLEAGVVASTANSMYTPDEIARQLKDSAAKVIITCSELYGNAVKAAALVPAKLPIISIKTQKDQALPQGAIDFGELVNTVIDIPDLEPPRPDDIAILPYSSGTTGLPKGVQLSHYNIVSNLAQLREPELDFIKNATADYQEITPAVLPMFHIYGFTICTLYVMSKGAKVLTLPRFQPDVYINVLRNNNISLIFSAPPLILFFTHHPDVKKEYFKHVNHIMSGAAPLGAKDELTFLEKVGKDLFVSQGYGLTEASPVVTTVSRTIRETYGEISLGSVGKVVANTEIKLVKTDDPAATPLGRNQPGELLLRGPQVMQGYHNNPTATKATIQDGWLKTGDLAYYDENGIIFITDRVKELIKVKGFQVAPAELEELLRSHPKVADAAVVGIPHDISGEAPRAFIIPKGKLDTEELHKFVNEKVARYKQLEGGIELVKEIPKNPAGKILRRQLKQSYLEKQS